MQCGRTGYRSYWMDCIGEAIIRKNLFDKGMGYYLLLANQNNLRGFPLLYDKSFGSSDKFKSTFLFYVKIFYDLQNEHQTDFF